MSEYSESLTGTNDGKPPKLDLSVDANNMVKLTGHLVRTRPKFSSAPCSICGYNGPGYYQPASHVCAAERRSGDDGDL